MKKFIFTHRFQLLLLTLIPLIISINLYRLHFVFGGAEEGLPFFNIKTTINLYANIWVDQIPGYPLIFEVGKIPFLTLLLFVSSLTNSQVFTSVFFVFSLMTIGTIGMFCFSLTLLKEHAHKNAIAFWSAVFYLLNPFSMSQVWGRHLSMQMYPYALIPCFLALLIYGLKTKKFTYAVLAVGMSVILAGAFNHPSYVISLFAIVFFYFLLHFAIYKKERVYTLLYALRAGALFALMNSFWLLPYLVQLREPNDFIGNRENLSILMGLSQYFPLSTILTLKQKYYFNMVEAFGKNYGTSIYLIFALLLPLILFIGFSGIRKLSKINIFFIFGGFFIALFVCAGGNRPFGPVVLWLMNHFSILEVYRNTYEKFGLIFSIYYSIIFGFGFSFITHLFSNKSRVLFIAPLSFIVFFLYVKPLWDGSALMQSDATNELPQYYQDYVEWNNTTNSDGRILLTPIMNGDATTEQWGDKQYRGIDVSPFILPNGTLTREIPGLPGNDFSAMLRKRIQQQDVTEVLKSLRVKYIVNRGDMQINQAFLNHINYLTKETYTTTDKASEVCNIPKNTDLETNIFYSCAPKSSDFTQVKFIRVTLKSNTKVMIETRLLDKNGLRTRWDGKTEKDYLIDQNTSELILPIGIETELPDKFKYTDVVAVEISFFPVAGFNNPTVQLNSIRIDSGKRIPLDTYQLVQQFGALEVYAAQSPLLNEVRGIQEIRVVPSMKTFFTQYKADDNVSFVVNENTHTFKKSTNVLLNYKKISKTMYSVTFKNTDLAYLWFGQNMNSSWKVIKGEVHSDLDVLHADFISEKNHYTADGYANLWELQGAQKYTLIYLPAVYVRIGRDITTITAVFIVMITVIGAVRFKKSKQTKSF